MEAFNFFRILFKTRNLCCTRLYCKREGFTTRDRRNNVYPLSLRTDNLRRLGTVCLNVSAMSLRRDDLRRLGTVCLNVSAMSLRRDDLRRLGTMSRRCTSVTHSVLEERLLLIIKITFQYCSQTIESEQNKGPESRVGPVTKYHVTIWEKPSGTMDSKQPNIYV